mmetsp:Transcript_61747/g.73256  ORF Transcript_61747/g.73256 Transcript_61747/m.73256 type:complete len:112 (-) Transcript_61747:116-451(-)
MSKRGHVNWFRRLCNTTNALGKTNVTEIYVYQPWHSRILFQQFVTACQSYISFCDCASKLYFVLSIQTSRRSCIEFLNCPSRCCIDEGWEEMSTVPKVVVYRLSIFEIWLN